MGSLSAKVERPINLDIETETGAMSAPHIADENRLRYSRSRHEHGGHDDEEHDEEEHGDEEHDDEEHMKTTMTTNMAMGNMGKTSVSLLRPSLIFGKSKAASMR